MPLNLRFSSIQQGLLNSSDQFSGSIPTINQLGIHSAHQENDTNPDPSKEIPPHYLESISNQEDTKVSFRDLNFSSDVSELFSFFEPDSSIFSKIQNVNTDSTDNTEVKDDSVVNESQKLITIKDSTKCNSSKSGKNGRPICMKSTETFPITDALKDVILDLDIGNTVRTFFTHDIIYFGNDGSNCNNAFFEQIKQCKKEWSFAAKKVREYLICEIVTFKLIKLTYIICSPYKIKNKS